MKKLILLLIAVWGLAYSGFSQAKADSASGLKFNLGLQGGLPVGDAHYIYSSLLGASIEAECSTTTITSATLSVGYTLFDVKSELTDIGAPSIDGFVPIKAGLKVGNFNGFFLQGEAGIVYSTESGGGHAFVYAPGIGYVFNYKVQAGVRYEGWSNDGTTSQISLQLSFRF